MKAHVLYIATLLAALALPAHGQTGSTDTKAAPGAPAMPYKLSLVTTGHNNGTVKVEDNAGSDNGGMIVVGKDTLFYGAPAGNNANAATVKLTVTPNPGYIVRKGYPKGYQTGIPGSGGTLSGSNPYTFKMPHYPTTVEVAYANPITSATSTSAITLKEVPADADKAKALLPAYIYITLGSGRKDSLAVTWAFKASGITGDGTSTFDASTGAGNRFTATLATALPDSLADATDKPFFPNNACTVVVANKANTLTPAQNSDKLTILPGAGDNLNSQTGGSTTVFNGTIGDNTKNTTVKELEVSADVKDATLTLSGVTVANGNNAGTTTIKAGANLTLKIEGNNNLGTLTVEAGATIVLDKADKADLKDTKIDNEGTFHDSTALVTEVEGTAALKIDGKLDGAGSYKPSANIVLTATTTTKDKEGTTTIFTWQRQNADGTYAVVGTNTYPTVSPINARSLVTKTDPASSGYVDTYTFTAPASEEGITKYRCLIERTATTGEGQNAKTATTLLSTQPAKVEVRADNPTISPVFYTLTLPSLTGATTTPAAGNHEVEEGGSFSFSIALDTEYDQSKPIVTTSDGQTIAADEEGNYILSNITNAITISVADIVKNSTVSIDQPNDTDIRIWGADGLLYISLPTSAPVSVYDFSGQQILSRTLPEGQTALSISSTPCLVKVAGKTYKITF